MDEQYKSCTIQLLELGDEHGMGCNCCRFSKGMDLPVPRTLTPAECAAAAAELSGSIWKDWTRLNAVIKRFEGVIQKRWLKKGSKARQELLRKAWPAIPTTHRPDFESFRTLSKGSRARTTKAACYLWPYLNLQDLQQRHLLLLFLNSRARNVPDTFRLADFKAAHLGPSWHVHPNRLLLIALGLEKKEEMDHPCDMCVMVFEDKYSPRTYGEIFDLSRPMMMLLPDQLPYISSPMEGLLSLEIQQGIYSFLLSCVKLILHDVADADMFYLAPHRPQPPMPTSASAGTWSSIAGHALEAPYRVPQMLDLERLKHLVWARRSSAEDHLWSLKEDPSYFLDHLREWSEHSVCRDSQRCVCEGDLCRHEGRVVCHGYVTFVFWDDIYRKLASMDPIETQLGRAIDNQVRLATDDEQLWTALVQILQVMRGFSIEHLSLGVPTSPRLRDEYELWGEAGGATRWSLKRKSPVAAHRVYRLFDSICLDKQTELHGLHGLIQEVQYMLDTDPEASKYVDSWIAEHFSDLALVSELLNSIDALAPWFDRIRALEIFFTKGVDAKVKRTRQLVVRLRDGIPDACVDDMRLRIRHADLDYPIDKRPSKATVDQMRSAERRLDLFWRRLENTLQDQEGIDMRRALRTRMFQPRKISRTPEWEEPVEQPATKKAQSDCLATLDPNASYGGFSMSASTLPKDRICTTPAKAKVKTRGQPASAETQLHPAQVETASPLTPPEGTSKISIPKKAYKVFCALLPSSNDVVQQRGEISWEELVAAMDGIGLEPEKLYGSVWIFKPLPQGDPRHKIDLDRSIQFHEPKQVRRGQKIPRPMVRVFGRRLKHAFGWGEAKEMFECA